MNTFSRRPRVLACITRFRALFELRALAAVRETYRIVGVLAIVAWGSRAALAENWDRFRGPNGGGQYANDSIPSIWQPENILWKKSLDGVGHGSPVIWGDKLFLMSADPTTGTQLIAAYELDSGTLLWQEQYDVPPHHINKLNSYASSTPAVDAHRLYVLWFREGQVTLAALDHAGHEVWRRDVGPFEEEHGFGISPVVVGNLVYVACVSEAPSAITAFDTQSGEVRWQVPREPGTTAFSTPCLLDPNAPKPILLTTSTSAGLSALDASTGNLLWHGFKEELSQRCVASPIVAGGLIFAGCGQGGNGKLLLAVQPGDANTPPQEVYRLGRGSAQVPTPIAAGDLLFVWHDRGIVSCFDLATGEQHWRERVGGDFHSSPVCIGNRVFGFSRTGQVVVLAAAKQFQLLARNELDENCHATPALANHRLFVRTEHSLFCIGTPTTE
ncbi:MAG: PQQ-binding-like beta-propeller repeat protein [Pirellulales bacterium]|nr:PQQ-binding-like beta-propeller repeat protein [Pirellulales bacterium]